MSEGKASHMGGGPKTIYKNLKWYDNPQVIQYTDQIIAELIIEDYKKCLT